MFLSTRCPDCATVFEVAPEQLRMRGGWVRCGECGAVFDGNAHLTDAAAPVPAVLRTRAERVVFTVPRDHQASDDDDTPLLPPIIAEPNPYVHPRAVPEFMDEQADGRHRRGRWIWGVAALLALLLLAVQILLVFRLAVATHVPMLRPVLDALCRPLACVVGYERRADQLAITASSLQQIEPGVQADDAPARLMLNLSLRNRHTHPQLWPALMLDLRDFSDTVVVRRALLPGQYLPETLAAQPLGANAEVALSIALTVTGVRVSGYQVLAFYP